MSHLSLHCLQVPRLGDMKQSARELLARNIRELRQQKGWSQDELAARADLHRTYIGTVERAEQSITVDSMEKLANALNVKVARLLEE
jgi:transcriptional regulator with XRE-family HTH domain